MLAGQSVYWFYNLASFFNEKEFCVIMKVKLKVVSQKGICHMNHKVGDEIIISENGIQGDICLHALYSIIPKAFAIMYGASFPWLKNDENPKHACPDGQNPVIFELELID